MRAPSKERVAKELAEEVTNIVVGAVEALEEGQSTALARSRLKEVSRKLTQLEFEYRGGCSW